MFDWGIHWEKSIPNKEDEVHKSPELDCFAVTSALSVFARPEVEVGAQFNQVVNMTGFRVRGGGRRD